MACEIVINWFYSAVLFIDSSMNYGQIPIKLLDCLVLIARVKMEGCGNHLYLINLERMYNMAASLYYLIHWYNFFSKITPPICFRLSINNCDPGVHTGVFQQKMISLS